jgi:hypothetical protein
MRPESLRRARTARAAWRSAVPDEWAQRDRDSVSRPTAQPPVPGPARALPRAVRGDLWEALLLYWLEMQTRWALEEVSQCEGAPAADDLRRAVEQGHRDERLRRALDGPGYLQQLGARPLGLRGVVSVRGP